MSKPGRKSAKRGNLRNGVFDIERLTDAQKERLYAECESISPASATTPLTSVQRKLHAAVRRPGRPRKGKGSAIVALSIERDLLRKAEHLARQQGWSRSDLFVRGIRALLAISDAA